MSIDYSVVIRTTGHAHEKYQALLNSIDQLDDKPVEVIVVLPEGYALPEEKLGYERFCFSPKGMVIQRLTGLNECRTTYALFCDDDVQFGSSFVRELYVPIEKELASFSAAPLYSFLPPKGLNALFCMINGSASPTLLHKKDRYVSVLKSSGYSYNRNLDTTSKKYYESQSLAWTCFFADVQAFRNLHMEQEVWLDAHGYSALDDQTMFYKAWLMGYKTVVVSTASYDHLDGKTSGRNNSSNKLYSMTFNRVIFWHRFIYSMQDSSVDQLLAKVAFQYRMDWIQTKNFISLKRKKMNQESFDISKKGYKDGLKYLESEEYKNLPLINKKV